MQHITEDIQAVYEAPSSILPSDLGLVCPAFVRTAARSFAADPCAVQQARTFASNVLSRWEITDRLDELLLCISELATNALCHASATADAHFLLCLTHLSGHQAVRIEVHDRSERLPVMKHRSRLDEQGRGLFLVEQLSERWGVEPRAGGKSVWTELQTQPAAKQQGSSQC
ncbi:ATP-binding protein [Streptomyces sp. A5-4]|uniref:ATP-binding protein n=1 Tax=Streptomyces sp. A5-4 TaxID=3384771 RepID=UPI003DA7F4C0